MEDGSSSLSGGDVEMELQPDSKPVEGKHFML